MDYVYFDPVAGHQLAVWHRGVTDTWDSKFIFWLSPLHFGYDFGLAVRILWATLGCVLPLLTITGVLMYWNRSLSKKWRLLRSPYRSQRANSHATNARSLTDSTQKSDSKTQPGVPMLRATQWGALSNTVQLVFWRNRKQRALFT